jgi:hypothetical protein
MTDLLSINTVAARLGLSVHQLRRWELMFGLEIKRGRGQQRQYRPEDMISITLKQELKGEISSPWQPLEEEFEPPAAPLPPQEISIGPAVSSTPTVITQSPVPMQGAPMPTAESTATTGGASGGGGGRLGLGEVTDQNYLDILGRALDLVNWSDDRADEFCEKTFGISAWDKLGRSQAEKLIAVLEAEAAANQQGEEAAV